MVWFGILAPAGTPPDIVAKLNDAITHALAAPSVQEFLKKLGVEPKGSAKVVKEADITLD